MEDDCQESAQRLEGFLFLPLDFSNTCRRSENNSTMLERSLTQNLKFFLTVGEAAPARLIPFYPLPALACATPCRFNAVIRLMSRVCATFMGRIAVDAPGI